MRAAARDIIRWASCLNRGKKRTTRLSRANRGHKIAVGEAAKNFVANSLRGGDDLGKEIGHLRIDGFMLPGSARLVHGHANDHGIPYSTSACVHAR